MPELPEVETIVRTLRPQLTGRTILEADLRWQGTLAFPTSRKFNAQIKGQRVKAVSRRAKFLNIELLSPEGKPYSLLIHLRMSGDLILKKGKIKPEKHDRLILALSDGNRLVFNDTRKFGRVWLTGDAAQVFERLGPEPFSEQFTPKWLFTNLKARRRQLKPLLLDQTFLAGLGNIYTDEALHMARLHPLKSSDTVTARQAERLWEAVRAVLNEGIRRNGASIDWVYRGGEFQNYFRVYDRDGQRCAVCGTVIQKLIVGQRGTHICPKCQKG